MPLHLMRSVDPVDSENGTNQQIVTHFEIELDLNGLETRDEQKVNTVSQDTTNMNAGRPNRRATTVKNLDFTETNVVS